VAGERRPGGRKASGSAVETPTAVRATLVVLASAPLLACAGSFPRLIQIGGLTPIGVLSFVLVIVAAALLLRNPITAVPAVPVVGVWSLYVLWTVLTTPLSGFDSVGLQEITAGLLVPVSVALAAGRAWRSHDWLRLVTRVMDIQFWGLLAIFSVQGLACLATGSDLLNIRPIAMSAVFLAAWYLGRHIVVGEGILRAAVLGIVVTVSLSRMAFAIYMLLVLTALIARAVRKWHAGGSGGRNLVMAILIVVAMFVVLLGAGPLHSRSTTGDVSIRVAGFAINGEGRAGFWRLLKENSGGVGITGRGVGAAQRIIEANFENVAQPHNDYLKLWFNLGWTGLALFVGGWLVAGWQLVKALRTGSLGERERAVAAAALLSGIAMLLFMATDNPIAYVVIAGQWGLVVGTALGLAGRPEPLATSEPLTVDATGASRRVRLRTSPSPAPARYMPPHRSGGPAARRSSSGPEHDRHAASVAASNGSPR
jgi:hypothetical protein